MMVAAVNWTNVLVALIAGAPAIIAAIFGARIAKAIKTPSGARIGAVAESTHQTGVANNLLLKAAANGDDAAQVLAKQPPPPPAV